MEGTKGSLNICASNLNVEVGERLARTDLCDPRVRGHSRHVRARSVGSQYDLHLITSTFERI